MWRPRGSLALTIGTSCVALCLSWATGVMGSRMQPAKDENLRVDLKLVPHAEVARFFGAAGEQAVSTHVYLLGSVRSKYAQRVYLELEVFSPNTPSLGVRHIKVGLIPPNEVRSAFFLYDLHEPPLGKSLGEVALDYRVVSIVRK